MSKILIHRFKWIALLPLILFSVVGAYAQGTTVRGRITGDAGEGLPGVTVVLKGTTVGTSADVEGNYSLDVPNLNGILVFSFIGYQSQEVPINNRSTINVSLATDKTALDEVVVVGYGEQRKATATGSITTVKGEEIRMTPITNVSNSLAGRLPGLTAVTRSGEPGYDGSTIRIRGANTLGNNDALVVVDGVPGRSLDRIDPQSIESITVLKDASAAIYGAQAANGVILITTKRGKVGKPSITVNYDHGFGRPTRLPDMADAAQYAEMLNEIDFYRNRDPRYTEDEIRKFRDGSDPWRYPNTDWFDAVLKPWSAQTNANAQLSGGSENMRYFVSVGHRFQDGYYRNSATNYNQFDFRTNLDGKISENVSLSFDVAGRQENRNFPTRGAGSIFWMVMRGKPHMHAYWPDGTPGPDIEYGDNPAVISTDATGYDRDKRYVLNTTAKLNINIPFVPGLSFTSNAGLDKTFRYQKRFETPWYLYSWDGSTFDDNGQPVLVKGKKGYSDPRLRMASEDNQSILLNAMFNYERTIADDHYIKFLIGSERRVGEGQNFSAFRRYFVSTAVDQMFAGGEADQNTGGSAYENAYLNYFGRVNYNFLEKYLVEFVWRYDGSYKFPQAKRFGFFPGISAGWRISEEGFWKNNLAAIDNFKIRGSWGQTGNDRIDDWQFLSSYAFGNRFYNNAPYIFGVNQENKTLYETKVPNENVTWEIANQSNIGFETYLFNSRLTLEADYFYNIRSQILIGRNASVPLSSGLSGLLPRENIGKVANRGFEFNVGYNNNVGELTYRIGANAGYAKNKILFWDETPGAPEYQRSTGRPMGSDLYYVADGIFRDQAAVDNYPHVDGARPGDVIFRDVNNDGVIDANDRVRYEKNDLPRWTGGLTLGATWKGFDLDVLFQGAAGAVRYTSTPSGDFGNFLTRYYENRWTPENPNGTYPRPYNRDEEYWRNRGNTFWLENTDYIRLKNIVLGYNLPASLTNRVGAQGLRVYVSGFNLLTFSPYLKDFDPESNNTQGTNYPLQKVVNAGVSVQF
jgi:TonB-linked SusC/RagA family outer membrane protein